MIKIQITKKEKTKNNSKKEGDNNLESMINKQKLHRTSQPTSKMDSIISNKVTDRKEIQKIVEELKHPGSTAYSNPQKVISESKKKEKETKKTKEPKTLNVPKTPKKVSAKKERKSHLQSAYFTEHGTLQFTIPLQPITKKNNGRIIKNSKTGKYGFIPSAQYTKYEKDCKNFIPEHYIKDPINVKATFYMRTKGLVDLTNLNESLHDIMQKYNCIVDDDCKIIVSTDGSRVMYDKENPRTEVIIERIKDYVSPFA